MPYTMQTYQQEVALRLSRYSVSLELDPGSLEMLVNRARREVQMATLSLFPERYAAIRTLDTVSGVSTTEVPDYRVTVTRFATNVTNKVYQIGLPADFIDIEAVTVSGTSGTWEAREVVKSELYGAMRNQNSMPTEREPIYFIERSPDDATYSIYVTKGEAAVAPADVRIYYQKALKYLELADSNGNPDVEANMSYEFEEFVVYQAMLQALKKTSFNNAKAAIQQDVEHMITTMESNYNSTVDRHGLLLPSRQGLYPNQAVPQVPNNSIMPDQQQQYQQQQQQQGQ